MHRNSRVLIKALDRSQFCKRLGKRDFEEESGVSLVPFHLQTIWFSKELTALPIVTCVFSTSAPNCCVGHPWRVFPVLLWDTTWVNYLASHTTALLAQVMFLNLCLLFSSSVGAVRSISLWGCLFLSETTFVLDRVLAIARNIWGVFLLTVFCPALLRIGCRAVWRVPSNGTMYLQSPSSLEPWIIYLKEFKPWIIYL